MSDNDLRDALRGHKRPRRGVVPWWEKHPEVARLINIAVEEKDAGAEVTSGTVIKVARDQFGFTLSTDALDRYCKRVLGRTAWATP